ncbi:MAG: sulfatase [Denitrovibrio sp.]|nr:MAG: sulfatase [Denitrovibrio sp.]
MNVIQQLLSYYLYMISIFFIGRLFLFVKYFDKFKDTEVNYWLTFLHGLRMDTMTACIILAIPLMVLTLSPKRIKKISSIFLKYYLLVILTVVIYIEIATIPFVDQYDVRPNFIFVEYLSFPKEIFNMVINEYLTELISAIIAIIIFSYFFITKFKTDKITTVIETKYIKRVLLFVPILFILVMGARSSIGHRPANLSDALWSPNRTINEITKNSLHSIGTAIDVNIHHSDDINHARQYGKMDVEVAINRVKTLLNITNTKEIFSLKRLEKSHFKTDQPKNLVIFLQESMGARFVEAFGGEKGITPNINKLSKEGIVLKNTYSNGTRSNRGIVGVTAGIYSVPGKTILKRNKASYNFFNIASLLKPYGYKTSFIYGGEARFDNMKNWFIGNGFTNVIEQKDFVNPTFVGTWGVCDGDLVVRANEEFKELDAKNQRFASLMFSQSSHSPYEYPDNKIEPHEGEKASLKSAIKYADFAVGEFIKLAKKEHYYKNTIFVVIADHNIRFEGDDMVPVSQFPIPALILGQDIEPMVYDGITSQPDVLATVLDLIGLDLEYPIMGHSIFSDKKQNLALLQFHTSYALLKDNKVVILRPGKKGVTFLYENERLLPTEHDSEMEKDTLALLITIDHLYNKQLYN